jgi:hypothetical protein
MSECSIPTGGVTYLRSRDVARVVQLVPDYVSRLDPLLKSMFAVWKFF